MEETSKFGSGSMMLSDLPSHKRGKSLLNNFKNSGGLETRKLSDINSHMVQRDNLYASMNLSNALGMSKELKDSIVEAGLVSGLKKHGNRRNLGLVGSSVAELKEAGVGLPGEERVKSTASLAKKQMQYQRQKAGTNRMHEFFNMKTALGMPTIYGKTQQQTSQPPPIATEMISKRASVPANPSPRVDEADR